MQEFPQRRFSFAQLLGLPALIWQICSPHTLVLFNKIHKLFGDTSELQHKLHTNTTRTDELIQKQTELSEHISAIEQQLRRLHDIQRQHQVVSQQSETQTISHVFSFPVNRPIIDTTRPFRSDINVLTNDAILSQYAPQYARFHCNAPWEYIDSLMEYNDSTQKYFIQFIVYPLFEKQSSEDAVSVGLHKNMSTQKYDMCIVLADGVSQSALGGVAAEYVCKYIYFEWVMAMKYDEFLPNPNYLHTKTVQLIREALYQAMYHVNKAVTLAIPKYPSADTQERLNERLESVGSQTTFACAFTYADFLVCVWMGNTRIILMQSGSHSMITADDIRFDSDQARFSSHPSTLGHSGGMFGDLQIQIFPLHDISTLHILIMSDGFEINKLGVIDSLFAQRIDSLTSHAKHASMYDDSSLVYMKLTKTRK